MLSSYFYEFKIINFIYICTRFFCWCKHTRVLNKQSRTLFQVLGLILQIGSTDGQHSFTCTKIAQFIEPVNFYFFRAKEFNTTITAEDNVKAIWSFHQELANEWITGKAYVSDEATKQRGIRNALSNNNFIEKYQ